MYQPKQPLTIKVHELSSALLHSKLYDKIMRHLNAGYNTYIILSSLKYSLVVHICILLSYSYSITAFPVSYKDDTNIYNEASETKVKELTW